MKDTLRRICELQLKYNYKINDEMLERGRLIRRTLVEDIGARREILARALGPFGDDFFAEGSDGITNKTELAWTRFCSKQMSPRATSGFYVVLHFSMDGSGVNIAVGCSSSKFINGYSVVLPPDELDKRCEWARRVVREERGNTDQFTDSNIFGAKGKLPKSFERACALVKKVRYDEIEDDYVEEHLIKAAQMLRAIYEAQRIGRELSPAIKRNSKFLMLFGPSLTPAEAKALGSLRRNARL